MPVYLISERDDRSAVKIGWTINSVRLRKHSIQTSNHRPVEVLRVICCDKEGERWLHDRYKSLQILNEWFTFDPEMLTIEPPFPMSKRSFVSPISHHTTGRLKNSRPSSAIKGAPVQVSANARDEEWGSPPPGCCWHPLWPDLSPHQWPGWPQREPLTSEADDSWKRHLVTDFGFMPIPPDIAA